LCLSGVSDVIDPVLEAVDNVKISENSHFSPLLPDKKKAGATFLPVTQLYLRYLATRRSVSCGPVAFRHPITRVLALTILCRPGIEQAPCQNFNFLNFKYLQNVTSFSNFSSHSK
jgi:hypothetical protein